ncbi:MAG: GNAT family N-acetyltransferase, partial [Clostridia bacterium]|nr:GNAT family N-acetyltransferase [Clostridia bacterium]
MCTTTECRKLHAGEMHALSVLLNTAFTGAADSRHFEDGLPKMWVDDDAHMQKHIAVFENGNMAGAVGVYPYDVYIGGRKLRFATVGNIGVLPEYRGRGYMQLLMDAAMAGLSALS